MKAPPLIAHVIHQLAIGGLENGLVNLINRMPDERYRHAIVCIADFDDFRHRIRRSDVEVHALGKRPGHDLSVYARVFKLFRRMQPTIVHSRNLSALDALPPAWLAGVPVRIHGEHGRDVGDLDGSNRRQQMLRRLYRPFVQHFTSVSRDLADYLRERVGVPAGMITQIYNGVDTDKFHPAAGGRGRLPVDGFVPDGGFVIGTIGRLQAVKNQVDLARAFVRLLDRIPEGRRFLRLAIVGSGPGRAEIDATLAAANATDLAWLPGARDDVADIMRGFDVFVLPSLGEGISNTILEAMASGLPVVATKVGGNPELVRDGETGYLVMPGSPESLCDAIARLVVDRGNAAAFGRNAREICSREFSMDAMVTAYMRVYDRFLAAQH